MDTLEADVITLIIATVILAIDVIIRVALLFYVPRNRKPTAALAWLFAIALIPIGATVAFLIIGKTSLSKKRLAKQHAINNLYERHNHTLHHAKLTALPEPPHRNAAKLAEKLTFLPATKGNQVRIIHGYDTIIEDMTKAVHTAQSYIYVEFFALALDVSTTDFLNALALAKARGVEVYVLFDTLGSRKYPGYRRLKKFLTAAGIAWQAMLPISLKPGRYNRPDLRNHRKILVIDNTDAYIGSMNMIDKTYHRKDDISYIELVNHLSGPAVNEAAAVFASDWYAETGYLLRHFRKNPALSPTGKSIAQVVPSGPGYAYRNNLKVFVDLIHTAQESIVITNPYLVPDESLLAALTSASLRGVKVSILNSQAMDQWMVGHAQRSYYEQLLKAGIEIWLYREPRLMHSKYMTIDSRVAIVGSSNLDIRSFELNHECSVIAYDKAVTKQLNHIHRADLEHSVQVELKTWRKRSRHSQFLDSIARLTSALQ